MTEDLSLILLELVLRIIVSLCFIPTGKRRKIGGGWAFAAVFVLGFIGMIIVWCSKKKESRDYTEVTPQETVTEKDLNNDFNVNNNDNGSDDADEQNNLPF